MPPSDRLTARQAIDASLPIVKELYEANDPRNFLLEGIEFDSRDGNWKILIGFDLEMEQKALTGHAASAAALVGAINGIKERTVTRRIIKEVILDAKNGQLVKLQPH